MPELTFVSGASKIQDSNVTNTLNCSVPHFHFILQHPTLCRLNDENLVLQVKCFTVEELYGACGMRRAKFDMMRGHTHMSNTSNRKGKTQQRQQ